jgi:putative DNA primase/helicase
MNASKNEPQPVKTNVASITESANKSKLPDGFIFLKDGLCYEEPQDDDPKPVWICSRLEVTASTRDNLNNNWGRVLEFTDKESIKKKWVMPMEMLAGRGEALHSTLLNMGLLLAVSPRAKALLSQYIQSCDNGKIAVCVNHIGWFDGCYVLPDKTIGDTKGKEIFYQTDRPSNLGFESKGTLLEWRDTVASHAIGNSRLSFAISASFTAPLLSLVGIEGGGFHFRGESSKGKTITLYLAGSVWGSHERKKMWRATSNGLEKTAFEHNDGLLLLDEMGEMNNREIGNTIYMLANGQGKQRMTEATPKIWRVLFLSTGEVDLKSAMLEAGNITRAGQEIRLIDIEAVTGKYGVFDVLTNGFTDSRLQAEALEDLTKRQHGTAGIQFLEQFTKDQSAGLNFINQAKNEFIEAVTPSDASTQIRRVINRFAIVAGGGELATHYGLTGWDPGEATDGARACFNNWLSQLGSTIHSKEHHQAIERIKGFIESHGESRFNDLDKADAISNPIQNRAGYKKRLDDETVYYFLPTVFKNEVCSGLNQRTVIAALKTDGYLKHEPNKNQTNTPRLEDGKLIKSYAVYSKILDGDDSE